METSAFIYVYKQRPLARHTIKYPEKGGFLLLRITLTHTLEKGRHIYTYISAYVYTHIGYTHTHTHTIDTFIWPTELRTFNNNNKTHQHEVNADRFSVSSHGTLTERFAASVALIFMRFISPTHIHLNTHTLCIYINRVKPRATRR